MALATIVLNTLKLGQIEIFKKVRTFLVLVPFCPEKKVNYILNLLHYKHSTLTFIIKTDNLSNGIFSQAVELVCEQYNQSVISVIM